MLKIKSLLFVLLLAGIIINLGLFIYSHKASYTYPFSPEFLKKIYGQSQYVNLKPISVLPDEAIYAFAGWQYVQGVDPAVFNADQPPLGKYFIGLSELLFRNERIPGPFFNVLCLVALFCLSFVVLKNKLLALVVVAFFSLEKIFIAQMLYSPLLDNIQLLFILLAFTFYILSLKNQKYITLAMVMLGGVMATKFWITGFVIYVAWIAHVILRTQIDRKYRQLKMFLLASPFTIITLILAYLPTLLRGGSPKTVLAVQHYIYQFHQGKLQLDPVAIWDLLLFNRWHMGVIKTAADWQISWPVITVFSLAAIIYLILKKKNKDIVAGPIGLLAIWTIVYMVLLSVGEVLPRYVFPLLPFLYILATWLVVKLTPVLNFPRLKCYTKKHA